MAEDLSLNLSSAASTLSAERGPSPPRSGHMGGLKIWLVLCLGYLVTTQHQRNEANKKKTFETNFEKLGKFRKAAIGETNLKSKPKEW